MANINEILKIDLSEEFHGVVDLDSQAEEKVKEELDSFILTETLAKHLQNFCEEYNSGSHHSGVWLSGFYGSGKSFFAKMLGFLLRNPDVLGTPMRDRFRAKLFGLKNESLLWNELCSLGKQENHVVLFDSAKKSGNHGTNFMLFANFLRSLGLLDNKYGLIEFDMLLNDEYDAFKAAAQQVAGKPWEETRQNLLTMSSVFRQAMVAQGMPEATVNEIIASAEEKLAAYDATKLRGDLERYLLRFPGKRIVFLVDEVSEAIEQRKINLLDLEGLAESLADMGRKVWTICIAQQRLDDVINASNLSKGLLTKLQDRFRTRIEIKAEEVDTIIRSRLLSKTDTGAAQLGDYFSQHTGLIKDITDIRGTGLEPTVTTDEYVDYFPFYKHQFKLLQYFLFGSGANVQSKIGTRGMLISAYDVLRKEVAKANPTDIQYHVNAQQLCQQAELSEDEAMRIRYEQADNQLREMTDLKYVQSGRGLLQTIHFLFKANATTTVENISKSYVNKPDEYHAVLAEIKKVLEVLVQKDVLILSSNQYRITNQTEQRIIEEKKRFENEMPEYRIKSEIKKQLKTLSIVRDIQMLDTIKFNISCDSEPFANPQEKYLKVELHDILSVRHTGQDTYLNQVKNATQSDKDKISIVPNADDADAIIRLVKDIEGTHHISERPNLTPEEKTIVAGIASDLDTKISQLNALIEKAYKEGMAVYCFNTYYLAENYVGTVRQIQKTVFSNIFTRKLNAELPDSVARGILSKGPSELQHFIGGEKEFLFFDSTGNFIGTGLSVTTEILAQAKSFISGKELAERLAAPPTGFSYGTVISSTAALFRGSQLIAKFSGEEYNSPNTAGAADMFANSRNFEKAMFKGISQTLALTDRRDIIDILKDDCQYKKWTGANLSYNMNDFDVVDAIRSLALALRNQVNTYINGDEKREQLFSSAIQSSNDVLGTYTLAVTEANCLSQARKFLDNSEEFIIAVERIEKAIDFIKNKLRSIQANEDYADAVRRELEATSLLSPELQSLFEKLNQAINANVVANYQIISDTTQAVRDNYISLFKAQAAQVSDAYYAIQQNAEAIQARITPFKDWNKETLAALQKAINDCKGLQLQQSAIRFALDAVECDVYHKSLRDLMYALRNIPNIQTNLLVWDSGIVTQAPVVTPPADPAQPVAPAQPKPTMRKLRSQLPTGSISKKEYRQWLTNQLQMLNSFDDNDTITFNE